MNKRMKKKACSYKPLSNKQRIKNQAKTIRQLHRECSVYDRRLDYWYSSALEKQQLLNEQDRTIESLKEEIRKLEVELKVQCKKPFWKKVFK